MASGIVLSFRPAAIRACAAGDGAAGRRNPARSGGAWWTPLFGWQAEADYIEAVGASSPAEKKEEEKPRRYRALTEEKARELRMKTAETETFHDAMYHSAIASRLASDLPRRS